LTHENLIAARADNQITIHIYPQTKSRVPLVQLSSDLPARAATMSGNDVVVIRSGALLREMAAEMLENRAHSLN
jgi:hypothetical protein